MNWHTTAALVCVVATAACASSEPDAKPVDVAQPAARRSVPATPPAVAVEEKNMPQMTLNPVRVAEAATAHRVIFAGASPRMLIGGMSKTNETVLELFEVKGQTALPLTTINLLLPVRLGFDVMATDHGEDLIIAYEDHGGAISHVRVQRLGTKERLELPPRKSFDHEIQPRFVRGGGTAIVISEYSHSGNGYNAVYLAAGATPRRIELGACLDAIGVETKNGLAVVKKTLRSGAQLGDSSPGELTVTWSGKSEAEKFFVLFDGRDVFDYDAVGATDGIYIVAVTLTGLEVILVAPGKTAQAISVGGLPKDLEAFSPALSVRDKVLSVATLAKQPYPSKEPTLLFSGVHSL